MKSNVTMTKRQKFYLLAFIYAVTCVSVYVVIDALHRAQGATLEDCRGGCVGAVVREFQAPAPFPRRPYSHEHLTSFSYTQPMIPPLQYDYPFPGKVTVTRVDEKRMAIYCPVAKPGNVTLACAHLDPCHIYMLNDNLLKRIGWNYDIVLRHEIAHCNGWPADHPGIEVPHKPKTMEVGADNH